MAGYVGPEGFGADDLQRLSTGCLYILLGRGLIDFPGSDSSHPSLFAVVNRSCMGFIRGGDQKYFPFKVPWDIWEQVVVPVLKDPNNQIRTNFTDSLKNQANFGWLQNGGFDFLLEELKAALGRGLQREGFLPAPITPPVETSPAIGEPIVNPIPDGDPHFPDPDGNITWPEGDLKLTYPIVQ